MCCNNVEKCKKIGDVKLPNPKLFKHNGCFIRTDSISEKDYPEFIRRYIEQTTKIDSLSPEELANRKAQLEKCIKGTAKKNK